MSGCGQSGGCSISRPFQPRPKQSPRCPNGTAGQAGCVGQGSARPCTRTQGCCSIQQVNYSTSLVCERCSEALSRRRYLVVEQPVQQVCGCGTHQVALQGCAGALVPGKQLAALQVQLQMPPAVLGFMCNDLPPAPPSLQNQGIGHHFSPTCETLLCLALSTLTQWHPLRWWFDLV